MGVLSKGGGHNKYCVKQAHVCIYRNVQYQMVNSSVLARDGSATDECKLSYVLLGGNGRFVNGTDAPSACAERVRLGLAALHSQGERLYSLNLRPKSQFRGSTIVQL